MLDWTSVEWFSSYSVREQGLIWIVIFFSWVLLISLTQSTINPGVFAFVSAIFVALGILIYQTKIEKLGLPYKRQTKVIDLAFEDWRLSRAFPELSLIRIFQPAFFSSVLVLLANEVIKWVT